MSSALEQFVKMGRQICADNNGFLPVDFRRVKGDYLHKEAPHTANGLGRCIPTSGMGTGGRFVFQSGTQTAEIYFSRPSGNSKILIRGENGKIISSGAGPSMEGFRAACDGANLDQRRKFSQTKNPHQPTQVIKVFDYLSLF